MAMHSCRITLRTTGFSRPPCDSSSSSRRFLGTYSITTYTWCCWCCEGERCAAEVSAEAEGALRSITAARRFALAGSATRLPLRAAFAPSPTPLGTRQ